MPDAVQSVRTLIQDFLAPELREIKTEIKRLDSKIDSDTSRLEEKVDSKARELGSDIRRLESKIDSDTERLENKVDSDVKRLESKMDAGFSHLSSLLENANLRAELEATRDIANLRERVTRLEVERAPQRQ